LFSIEIPIGPQPEAEAPLRREAGPLLAEAPAAPPADAKLQAAPRPAALEIGPSGPRTPIMLARVPEPVVTQPARQGALVPLPGAAQPALIQPPVSPVELVELSQPPRIETRVQLLPNQQVTTLDGKPLAQGEIPPDKIAIGDLDADGKGTLMLDMTIDAQGRSPARTLDYRVDGRPLRPSTVFDQPIPLYQDLVKLSLAPGTHRFTAEAANVMGVSRSLSRDIFVRGLPGPKPSRLKMLTIAPSFMEKRIQPIRFSDRDARDLRKFLARHLVSPEDGGQLYSIDEEFLEGTTATTERVRRAVASLKAETLGEGDLVLVVIESHFINVNSERRLVATDTLLKIPPAPGVDANELARDLGEVARTGCKVVVLLDGVITTSNQYWDTDITDWVRYLRDEQKVITFVASNSGPSQIVVSERHRAFAQAVLDSVNAPMLKDGAYLLNDFRDVVVERVLNLTGRQQQAACYLPESMNGQFPIFNPQPSGR
jgi:hypothetical protein